MQVVEQTTTTLRLLRDPGAGEVLVLAAGAFALYGLWFVFRDRRLRWREQMGRFVGIGVMLLSIPFSLYFAWRPVEVVFDKPSGQMRLVETTGFGTTVRTLELPLAGLRCEVEPLLYSGGHQHAHLVVVSGTRVEELTGDQEHQPVQDALAKTVNDFLEGR